ncbi:MAG: HD domain-containing protein [Candidatus Cardinium sp.]
MLIMDLASPVSFYFASRFIILRMKEFIGDLSIAESMGKLYGTTVRIITAIMGIIMTIAILAVQFKVGLLVVTSLFSISKEYVAYYTIGLALLVIIYTTLGGAKSVSITDVYQFSLFSICFPILIFTLLYHSKDLLVNWQKFIVMPQFNLLKVCTWNDALIAVLANFIWHSVFPFDPARIQRVYMTSVEQAAKVFFKSAIIRVLFPLLFFSIAAALYIGGHNISPHQSALDYIIHLQYFPGMKGILITAIIALLMSTADSNLHAASVLFTNDIYATMSSFNTSSYKLPLKIAQIASGIIGILTIFIVLHTTSVIQLMNKTVHFYVPAITIPMIMACFGFRPHPTSVIWTIGISTALATYRIFIQGQQVGQKDIFNSLLGSAFILTITHYLLPKKPNTGWVGIPDDNPVQLQNQETKRWWLSKIKAFQAVFTQSYWANIFPKSATTFIASGIYFIIYSSVLLCYVKQAYGFSYIYWYMAVMIIGTIVAFYPTLHAYKQKGNSLLHGLWPIFLYVVLYIASITYMKLSHFSPMSCAFFIVNIGLSSLLLPYTIIIFMLFTSLFIHKWIPPYLSLISCKELITIESMIGLAMLVSCLVYRYIRNKANIQLQTTALTRSYEQQYALASLHNHANWNRLDPTYSGKVLQDMADALEPYVENLPIQQHQKKLYLFSQSLLQRAKEERTLTLDSKSICKVDIEKLILKSYETVRRLDIPVQFLLKKQTKEKYLFTETTTFERLLTINFLNLCQDKCATDHAVYLTISDTLLSYPFPKPYQIAIHSTYEKQLKYPTLPALAFLISTDTDSLNILPTYVITDEITSGYLPKTINNLYQEESRQIVQAHGGYIQIIETETGLTCLYILPIDGKKVMRFKRYHTDDLSNKVAETNESLIQEKEVISLLVSKTTLTEQKVTETINFIKNAHGNTIRKSGEPYYTHPMEVAKIVLEATNNADTILAALLHDVVEDTMVTLEQIELLYGMEVAYIVDMVTHYNTYGYRWKLDHSDSQIILNQCKDIRVVQIKLADRLHNLRTISVRKLADQKRIAKDTMDFYIPWSKKNNILTWLSEMEHICEQILLVNPA